MIFLKVYFNMYDYFAYVYICVCLVPKSKSWKLHRHQEYKWYIHKYRQAKYPYINISLKIFKTVMVGESCRRRIYNVILPISLQLKGLFLENEVYPHTYHMRLHKHQTLRDTTAEIILRRSTLYPNKFPGTNPRTKTRIPHLFTISDPISNEIWWQWSLQKDWLTLHWRSGRDQVTSQRKECRQHQFQLQDFLVTKPDWAKSNSYIPHSLSFRKKKSVK